MPRPGTARRGRRHPVSDCRAAGNLIVPGWRAADSSAAHSRGTNRRPGTRRGGAPREGTPFSGLGSLEKQRNAGAGQVVPRTSMSCSRPVSIRGISRLRDHPRTLAASAPPNVLPDGVIAAVPPAQRMRGAEGCEGRLPWRPSHPGQWCPRATPAIERAAPPAPGTPETGRRRRRWGQELLDMIGRS